VRIVAKLTTVEADKHLWAETYDRRLTDIFAIQTDVALHIAAALEAELSIDEQARIRRQPTKDVQAYQLFLQGRQFYIEYTPESMTRAIECFEAALARDPGFALAAAHIAIAYTELCEHGSMAVDVARPRAADAANRALRLDSELSAAHCALGHLKTVLEYDWDGAEQAFERALDLSPSNADAYALYGRLCSALERYEESITLNARARELNPLAHRLDLVTSLVRAGRHEQAIALGEEARGFDPDFPRARATLGWAYFLSGRRDDGIAELELSVSLSGRSTLWLSQLGEAYAMAGLAEKARVILGELHDRARTGFVSPYHFAYLYAGLGEAERAIECLERAVAERSGASYLIKGSFLLSGLHGHPRFTALLRRMKLA
jgi:tetratricopeptide (TPR) repeat protein